MKHKAIYYDQLRITPEQVAKLPQITPQIKLLMAEKKEKGLCSDHLYYMEASADASVRKILDLHYTLPSKYRKSIPLEAHCAALELDPLAVLQAIISSADRLQNYVTSSRMSNSKRDVADALISAALLPGDLGTADRRLFMQATGMLPQPKGAQTLIQVTQNASHTAPTAVLVAPQPERTIRKLADRLNALALPEAIDVLEEENS